MSEKSYKLNHVVVIKSIPHPKDGRYVEKINSVDCTELKLENGFVVVSVEMPEMAERGLPTRRTLHINWANCVYCEIDDTPEVPVKRSASSK